LTEVREPGANSEVTSVPFVLQLKTRTISHQRFTDSFSVSVTASHLKTGLEAPKASEMIQKKLKAGGGG